MRSARLGAENRDTAITFERGNATTWNFVVWLSSTSAFQRRVDRHVGTSPSCRIKNGLLHWSLKNFRNWLWSPKNDPNYFRSSLYGGLDRNYRGSLNLIFQFRSKPPSTNIDRRPMAFTYYRRWTHVVRYLDFLGIHPHIRPILQGPRIGRWDV